MALRSHPMNRCKDVDEACWRQEQDKMLEVRKKKKKEENLQKKRASSSWEVTKFYGYNKYLGDSKSSISFSIRIHGIEKEAVEIVSEIPDVYLDDEEICARYVFSVLSKAKIHSSIRNHIFRKVSKDLFKFKYHGDHGILVKYEVEAAVKEAHLHDYDSEEGLDEDCIICGQELSLNHSLDVLTCSHKHTFHHNCILPWLFNRQDHTCPTCGESLGGQARRAETCFT